MRKGKMKHLLKKSNQKNNLNEVLLKIVALVLCFSMILFNLSLSEEHLVSSASSDEEKMPETSFMTKDELMALCNQYPNGLLEKGTDADKKIRINFGWRPTSLRYAYAQLSGSTYEWKTAAADQSMKWLLAGSDASNSIVIFSEEPIANIAFQSSTDDQTYNGLTVYSNHWGASRIREKLKTSYYNNSSYFSSYEQGLVLTSKIVTRDNKNKVNYTTEDKLYLPSSNIGIQPVKIGETNKLGVNVKYLAGAVYARSASNTSSTDGYKKEKKDDGTIINTPVFWNPTAGNVASSPAAKLDMSNVSFLSSADSSTTTSGAFKEIASDTPQMFREKANSFELPASVSFGTNSSGYYVQCARTHPLFDTNGARLVVVALGTDGKVYRSVKSISNMNTTTTESINLGTNSGLPSSGTRFKIAKAWAEKMDYSSRKIVATDPITIIPTQSATSNTTAEKVNCILGQKVNLGYKIYPSNTTENVTTTWTSNNTNVATVADGVVTGHQIGSAIVKGTTVINGKTYTATYNVTVDIIRAKSITLDKTSVTMKTGGTQTLKGTVLPTNTMEDKTIVWSSDNNEVARVENGVVTAVKAGTAKITAKLKANESITATCEVTVTQPITGVNLNKTMLKMVVEGNEKLEATVLPEDATDKSLRWSIEGEGEDIVTVDQEGNIKAKKAGTAIVVVSAANGDGTPLAECTVFVEEKRISIEEEAISIEAGENKTLVAKALPEDVDYEKTLKWSSSNSEVATVENGVVEAKKAGTATITVSLAKDETVKATCEVTVTQAAKSMRLDKETIEIEAGGTGKLTATVQPEDTTQDKTIVWSSDNNEVARVENGVVTAVKAGTARITAKLQANESITATCEVTVTQLAQGINLNKNSTKIIVGKSETLEATVQPEDTTQDKTIIWSSDNNEVARVENGVVTAVKAGTARITAKLQANESITATCEVTVTQPITGVNLNKTMLKMVVEGNEKLEATVLPEDATDKSLRWSIEGEGEDIVTVDQEGNIKAKKAGTAIVVVSAANGDGTPLAECTVFVEEKRISIEEEAISIEAGENKTLVAKALPEDVDYEKTLKWSSSNSEVATVENGVVEAKKAGTATITVSLAKDETVKATCEVTVTQAAESMRLDKETIEIEAGGTGKLTATVLPEDTTQDKTIVWSSDNNEVARVENGVVTAVKAGTARITAKLQANESITATCEVTVKDPDYVVSGDGTTSIEITKNGMVWLKEDSKGTNAWCGLDNTNGVFEQGSRFWVRLLTKEEDPETWQRCWDQVDDTHKNSIEADRVNVFLVGVTAPDGTEYRNFAAVPLYVQIGEDWDKDDIKSIFISSGEDEVIASAFVDNMNYPAGQGNFAKLILRHFSPYLVYDMKTGTFLPSQDNPSTNVKDPSTNSNNQTTNSKGIKNSLRNYLKTGDIFSYIIVAGFGIILVLSLIMIKSKRKDK